MSLGLLYEAGRGVRQDLAEARRWFEGAAEQDHASAIDRLSEADGAEDVA